MTLKLERATTWTQKRLKPRMVSSFDPHNMCAKVERITAKTRCTKRWAIYIGNDKPDPTAQKPDQTTHKCFKETHNPCASSWLVGSNGSEAWSNDSQALERNTRSVYFFLIRWIHKRLKLGMVSSFDPHDMCAKVERITAKTGCTSCTNSSVTKAFHFSKLISTQEFFCIQHATFKATY